MEKSSSRVNVENVDVALVIRDGYFHGVVAKGGYVAGLDVDVFLDVCRTFWKAVGRGVYVVVF